MLSMYDLAARRRSHVRIRGVQLLMGKRSLWWKRPPIWEEPVLTLVSSRSEKYALFIS